jgi:hypothetical protein
MTKKELYNQHVAKYGNDAVSDSAFRKRLSSWRTTFKAIDTPKLYGGSSPIKKNKKKAEAPTIEGEKYFTVQVDGEMVIETDSAEEAILEIVQNYTPNRIVNKIYLDYYRIKQKKNKYKFRAILFGTLRLIELIALLWS